MTYDSEYAKAYVELYEIIKNLPLSKKDRIPNAFIDFLIENMDKNYNFIYDNKKELQEQNIKVETKALLVKLYEEYLAKPEEKEFWNEYDKECKIIAENEKKEKYNPDDIFKKRQSNIEQIQENISENKDSIIEYKESLLKRILNKIKNLFHK